MSTVKDKSENNIESADLLIKEGYFNSSVHCSYYGCFQWILYTLKHHLNTTYAQLKIDSMGNDSHIFTIRRICSEYRTKGKSLIDSRTLERKLMDLKSCRVKADYDPDPITMQYSEDVLNSSRNIINELKATFR